MAKKQASSFTKGQSKECASCNNNDCKNSLGCTYFLGVIGAAFYFVPLATGFWGVVLAILKSLVWPAFVVYKLLALN